MTAAIPLVDRGTRRRRAQRLALVRAHRGATRLVPRRSRRADVCAAADLLTALGARVEVRPPVVSWPRPGSGRVVVADRVGPLDELVLRTVVPDRVLRTDQAAEPAGTVCPVVVRYRTEDGADLTALLDGDLGTAIRRATSLRDLVIEVRLLPHRRGNCTTMSA